MTSPAILVARTGNLRLTSLPSCFQDEKLQNLLGEQQKQFLTPGGVDAVQLGAFHISSRHRLRATMEEASLTFCFRAST